VARPGEHPASGRQQRSRDPGRVGNKKPTQKIPKKTTQKTHKKCFFFGGFLGFFLNFKFFMKIIQTFLFETDFL
jgi:hypothetical protein